jgi:hypothetical protein
MVDGKKEILTLTSVRELTVRAMAVKEAGASSGNKEPVPNSTPSNAHLPSVTSLPMASTPTSGSMSGGGWP